MGQHFIWFYIAHTHTHTHPHAYIFIVRLTLQSVELSFISLTELNESQTISLLTITTTHTRRHIPKTEVMRRWDRKRRRNMRNVMHHWNKREGVICCELSNTRDYYIYICWIFSKYNFPSNTIIIITIILGSYHPIQGRVHGKLPPRTKLEGIIIKVINFNSWKLSIRKCTCWEIVGSKN